MYILQENYNKANEYFEKIIEYTMFNPYEEIDIYSKMGGFCMKKRDFDIAIQLYQQVLVVNPNHADTYNNIGASYCGLRNFEEGIKYFQQALKKDPNNIHARQNLQNAQQVLEELNKKE